MGWGTLEEVGDESGDPQGGPARDGGPAGRSGTSWGTLGKVRDGSEELQGGPDGQGTIPEVWDGSCDPR